MRQVIAAMARAGRLLNAALAGWEDRMLAAQPRPSEGITRGNLHPPISPTSEMVW
jgi:hypothetical protein